MSAMSMSSVARAALDLQAFCEAQTWRFCFIGGIANAYWGQPRYTEDVDISLLTGFGEEETYIERLIMRFAPRRPDAAEFALRARVLLLRHENGTGLDIGLAAFPYEEATIERAIVSTSSDEFNGLRLCSAEDFIIYKAFAGRDHDWSDIEGVMQRQTVLDFLIVRNELPWLLETKHDTTSLDRLASLATKYEHKW